MRLNTRQTGRAPTEPPAMPTIAAKTYRLPIVDKLVRGACIISSSTDNPNAPGNEATLAAFHTAQAGLAAANADYNSAVTTAQQLLAVRNESVREWNSALNSLASFTESVTRGEPVKVLSTGFDIRSDKTPPRPVAQIIYVSVAYTGTPGYSTVTWRRDPHADAYRVQWSPEEITDTSWTDISVVTEATFHGNGATPGQRCWYRIAGVNRLGQGPWSPPALRPVM